ncbi:MAG: class I SAM-dependent methyltransferase [Candidatus Andersenbacteria bacterium]
MRGKRVLDLASGEGYGAALLARQALQVTAVELNAEALHHAASRYSAHNLSFVHGSITQIPIEGVQHFDVITCFEALEHVTEHEELLREVRRLLKPGGVFMVSTPNKAIYEHDQKHDNPYHIKELFLDEFEQLTKSHFANVQLFGQRVLSSSQLWPIRSTKTEPLHEFYLIRTGTEFVGAQAWQRTPKFFIAVCSDGPLTALTAPSQLTDVEDLRYTSEVKTKLEVIAHRNQIEAELRRLQALQVGPQADAAAWRKNYETLHAKHEALWREVGQLRPLRSELEATRMRLEHIEHSRTYRLAQRLARFKKALVGPRQS